MAMSLYEMTPKIYDEYISTKIEKINFDEVFRNIKTNLKKNQQTKILDLCCGTGILPRKWLSKLKKIKYVGVDINKPFLDFARKQMKNKPNFNFVYGNAAKIKLKDKFDIIIATSSYHHIVDSQKKQFLNNIKQHLKENGTVIFYEKLVAPFKNKLEATNIGTKFYAERINYMMKKEKLSETQLFALYNELYLTSVRKEEYKVPYQYLIKQLKTVGLNIIKEKKLWPKNNIFHNSKVGDFVIVFKK
ncbi:MAG: class I SAM-dependent methyltransferase [archaeon]|nr:class I SAM-dependent methyltransferase [archaeon]